MRIMSAFAPTPGGGLMLVSIESIPISVFTALASSSFSDGSPDVSATSGTGT